MKKLLFFIVLFTSFVSYSQASLVKFDQKLMFTNVPKYNSVGTNKPITTLRQLYLDVFGNVVNLPYSNNSGSGTVTNVSGTNSEITVANGTTAPVIGISSSYTTAINSYADNVKPYLFESELAFGDSSGKMTSSNKLTFANDKLIVRPLDSDLIYLGSGQIGYSGIYGIDDHIIADYSDGDKIFRYADAYITYNKDTNFLKVIGTTDSDQVISTEVSIKDVDTGTYIRRISSDDGLIFENTDNLSQVKFSPFGYGLNFTNYTNGQLGFKNTGTEVIDYEVGSTTVGGTYNLPIGVNKAVFDADGYARVKAIGDVYAEGNSTTVGVNDDLQKVIVNASNGMSISGADVLTTANGNFDLKVDKGVNNLSTVALTSSALNSAYPTATVGFKVYCTNIAIGKMIYEKLSAGWIGYSCIVP